MQFALGITALIAPWFVAGAAIGSGPGVFAMLTGRPRLGAGLVAAAILPIVWYAGSIFVDLLRFAELHPAGSRPPPWGGMGGFVVVPPLAWGGFVLLAGGVLLIVWSFLRRLRDRNGPTTPTVQ